MIYIASPYSHHEKEVVEQRVKVISEYSAKLLSDRKSNISPITIGSTILKYAEHLL